MGGFTSFAQNNHDFYNSYVKAANQRNFKEIENMIGEEVLINGIKSNKNDVIAGFKWVLNNMPDHQWQIVDLFVDGERIAARLRNSGTPIKESFYGRNDKGQSVEFTEFASYKTRNGKFIEMWYLVDAKSVIDQLKNQP